MLYKLVRPLLKLFMVIFFPRKLYGKENVPEGRQVIVCNHFGKIDIFFVGSIYKGKTFFLAKKELFEKKFFGKIIRSLGGIPVMRDSVDLDCIREGLKVLKRDERLAIFPEGRRNFVNEELQELKPGAAMFAFKSKSPIVPMIMEKKAYPFKRCNMMVGKPLYLDEYFDRPYNSELNEELNAKVREVMLQTQSDLRELLKNKGKK